MNIDRRQFIFAAAAVAAVRTLPAWAANPAAKSGDVVDAGPIADFATDKVYDAHREEGFFIVRRDEQLLALSSVCTHKGCKVRPQPDQSYICKYHGSLFDRDGKVTKGPATRDLPRLAIATDNAEHVLVDLHRQV